MYHSVIINIVLLIESLLLLKKSQQLLKSQWKKKKVSDTFLQTLNVPVTLPITFTLENLEQELNRNIDAVCSCEMGVMLFSLFFFFQCSFTPNSP